MANKKVQEATKPPPRNLIVSGIPRTGTSALVQALRVPEFAVLSHPDYNSDEPFENQGECSYTVNGINGEGRTAAYAETRNKIIKIVGRGLEWTDPSHFASFHAILVMHRPWRDHEHSVLASRRKMFTRVYWKLKMSSKVTLEEFLHDMAQPSGVAYGMGYTKLFTDAVNRKYVDKIVMVSFDRLLGNPEGVGRELGARLGNVTIDPSVIRVRPTKGDMPEFKEFKPGFFGYLDTLQQAMASGNLKPALELFNTWGPIMGRAIKNHQDFVRDKYGIETGIRREE